MNKRMHTGLAFGLMSFMLLAACQGNQNSTSGDHKLVFSMNYANVTTEIDPIYVKDGEYATKPSDPTREGYAFDGWSLNSIGTKPFDFENTRIYQNYRLFATWAMTEVTVTFVLNNGEPDEVVTVSLGETVTPPSDPVRENYSFAGWVDEFNNPFDFSSPIEENISIYASWSLTNAVVTFISYDDVVYQTTTVKVGETLTKPSDPTREDYEFVNWYTDSLCTTLYDFDTIVEDNFTLYAGWNQLVATVTLDANYEGGEDSSVKVTIGETLKEEDLPAIERTGYDFLGWYTDSSNTTLYDFTTTVTKNFTLYAGWDNHDYTITFDLNYSGSTPVVTTAPYLGTVTEIEDPTRSGYEFTGWYTEQEATNQYDFETLVTSNLTLYAGWQLAGEEEGEIYVTYDLNYTGGGIYQKTQVESGVRLNTTRPATDPTRDGYTFEGWYMESECTTSAKWSNRVLESTTLYAKWLKIYNFEAEYVDVSGKRWQGYSDEGYGISGDNSIIASPSVMSNTSELAPSVSNGYFVQKLLYNGAFIDFHVYAQEADSAAQLTLRLTSDMVDLNFAGTQDYTIKVNDDQTYYLNHNLTGSIAEPSGITAKRLFDNYLVGIVSLKQGDNVIRLLTSNNNMHTGTYHAETPIIDCIYVASSTTLTWTDGYCFPENVGQSMGDVSYEVQDLVNYSD